MVQVKRHCLTLSKYVSTAALHNLIDELYTPCLKWAERFDRGVGYFTTGWLTYNVAGLSDFASRGGKMRLITSPILSTEDTDAIIGAENQDGSAFLRLEAALLENVEILKQEMEADIINAFSWMLYDGIIDMRFAIPCEKLEEGDFHDKFGIFYKGNDALSFSGSINDSKHGFQNYESIKVFKTWAGTQEYVDADTARFEKIWNRKDRNLKMFTIPQAVKNKIFELRTPDRPYSLPAGSNKWVHQDIAVKTFLEKEHGILAMATGTGKTITALRIINQLFEEGRIHRVIITILRYYYASACGSRVGRTSLYDDFLKQFFPDIVDVDDVSDEATATKIVDTVNQILREIRTYRKLIAGIWPYEVGQPLTDWDRKRLDILIRFLDFDIVYPLLLAAVQLKQKTFADLVHMLEKFMFRHKSVCNLGHQKLSELYMQEAVKIRRDPENYRLTGLRTTLKEYIETECTDAVFKVGLSNLKYRTNGGNKPLRYLFSTLNEHIEWYRNGAVGAPAPQKGTVINYDNVTIEHIASQSPSAAVPGFTSENIHTLSNLTLLTNGENDRAKNKSYTAKKAIYHDSEYVINKYFDSVDDWSVESAKAWEQYLQEMVCKVFVV